MDISILFMPDGAPFKALGELSWYDVVPDAGEATYLMGVKFLEISGTGKEQLATFLKSHEDNKGFFQRLIR